MIDLIELLWLPLSVMLFALLVIFIMFPNLEEVFSYVVYPSQMGDLDHEGPGSDRVSTNWAKIKSNVLSALGLGVISVVFAMEITLPVYLSKRIT